MTFLKFLTVLVLAMAVLGGGAYFTYDSLYPYRNLRPIPVTQAAAYVPPLEREIAKAQQLRAAGKLSDAQSFLRKQLRVYGNSAAAGAGRKLLGEINTEMFFSTDYPFGKTEYVVRRGDTLWHIARQLDSNPTAIIRTNNLASDRLHPGDHLFVPDRDFTVTLDLPNDRVVVLRDDHFFTQYPVVSMDLPRSRQPQITTKVTARTFWRDGQLLTETEPKNGAVVTPWIQLAQSGYVLYGVAEGEENEVGDSSVQISEAKTDPDIPPHGIALLKDDLTELQLLIDRGTPVTIIRPKK